MESGMAERSQSEQGIGLSRRKLLASAAVVTAARITPAPTSARPAPPLEATDLAEIPTGDISALNVCAETARRISEIVARNRIRQEAQLPLLSIPQELRRMKALEDAAKFEEFAALHRQEVWDEVLAPVREAKGNSHWRPTGWMEGMGYQAQVSEILRVRFEERASCRK
jgi:hypothetical protein